MFFKKGRRPETSMRKEKDFTRDQSRRVVDKEQKGLESRVYTGVTFLRKYWDRVPKS